MYKTINLREMSLFFILTKTRLAMKLQDLIMKYLAAKNGSESDVESVSNQDMKDSYLFLFVNSFSLLVREKELYELLSEVNMIDLFQSLLSKHKTSSEQLISDIILFIQNCQTPKSPSKECVETSTSQKLIRLFYLLSQIMKENFSQRTKFKKLIRLAMETKNSVYSLLLQKNQKILLMIFLRHVAKVN